MRWSPVRRRPRLATQALLGQVALLLVILGCGFGLVSVMLRSELEQQYEQRALAVARAVAADPAIATEVAGRDRSGDVQRRAEAVRLRSGVLFVVVADDHGIRYSHPDPARIGQRVSTEPEALAGQDVVTFERGTLGLSARGKVPLTDADGRVVGQVSVGIAADAVTTRVDRLLRDAGAFTAVGLLFGIAAAALLARGIKRQTLGLEPADLANLLREREAVLHRIDEGVLALDPAGRITICNDAAGRLLGGMPVPGTPVAESGVPDGLRPLLDQREGVRGALVSADRTLVVTAAPVQYEDRDLGLVLTLRDRTDLDEMTRELGVIHALSDALRAQAHEYTNRLHTLSGLLGLGHAEEALSYLRELSADPLATGDGGGDQLRDPYLRGLLAGKNAAASERGVQLRLSADSFLPGPLWAPLDVVTVLGNLLENAVTAAAAGHRRPAWVEASVLAEADTVHLVVVDSGNGVPAELADRLFRPGVTTCQDCDRPHGIGLALARQVTRRHGGELELTRSAGTDCGAVFVARLPGVIAPEGRWAAEPDLQVGPARGWTR